MCFLYGLYPKHDQGTWKGKGLLYSIVFLYLSNHVSRVVFIRKFYCKYLSDGFEHFLLAVSALFMWCTLLELAITFCHFGGAVELKKQISSSLRLVNSSENYVAFKVGN